MPKRSLRAEHALVPHWFLRQAMPIYEIPAEYAMVFVALCDHAKTDGIAWCTQRRLAEEAGVARSTVQKALARFIELEILLIHEQGGAHVATRYRIAESCPVPAKVFPLPTRKARWVGDAWEGYDEDVL